MLGGSIRTSPADQSQNIAAIVDGQPLSWSTLRPALAELAGAQALEEAVLDAALDRLLAAQGLSIDHSTIDAERQRLIASIEADSGLTPALADQALARIRISRGLGPVRFNALLLRTAKLRALASGDATFTSDELSKEVELATGSKVTAILTLLPDEKEASVLRDGLLEPPGPNAERLSVMARARSIDASAGQGGRVGPIHPADPRVSDGLRSLFSSLPIGELSPVIAIDDGYAILMIESRTEPVATTPEIVKGVEGALRTRKERLAMERLARRLVAQSGVNVLDESLRWNWDRSREGANR